MDLGDASHRSLKSSLDFHRNGHQAHLRELDLKSLPYVTLPRAPVRCEQPERTAPNDVFEIRDAKWRLRSVEKLPPTERPDPAFRRLYPVASGLLLIDDLGHAQEFGPIQAAALRYDRTGRLAAKAGFAHRLYRLGVHPLGRELLAMSDDCVLHAYDDELRLLWQVALADSPQIQALQRRFKIGDLWLKNYIRCVAFSRDHLRYLFTAVDEAWCVTTQGHALWGVKLPIREGWERIGSPAERSGMSSAVKRALALMNLSLPLTTAQFKQRHRELAMDWHPDHHLGSPKAQEKMKLLNSAVALLTGIDLTSTCGRGRTDFVRDADRHKFDLNGGSKATIRFDLGGELSACDWIYAADFGARTNSVYLAGYSGRVAMLNQDGEGVRVYDTGTSPERIIDTGEHLYMLTRSRLYVLRGDTLQAVIDTLDSGDLMVAKTGFGSLEKKRFRWFSKDGGLLGSVLSRDPIRRVYSTPDAMVVETRQRRAVIGGAPSWWD
jgi:DnaJ domain